MSDFALVCGLGHCGTKWLATVLDRPEQGVRFYHERKMESGVAWWDAMLAEAEQFHQPYHDMYFCSMKNALGGCRWAGDANSWDVTQVAQLREFFPVKRVVVLLRDGILQLRSFGLKKVGLTHERLDLYARRHWEMSGRPFGDFDEMSMWEKMCVWWALFPGIVDHISAELPDVQFDVFRLEDLTGDLDTLRALVASFGLEIEDNELEQWQRTDIHRHVHGTRHPTLIYHLIFNEEQRAAYERICGETVKRLGYTIPKLFWQ